MHIALVTRTDLPDWEVDDEPFHQALSRRGSEVARPAWSDPTVDWSAFDACLIRTTWDYQEHLPDFLAWAATVASKTRLFNPLEIVRWNTHKRYLADLAAAGVDTVPTVFLSRGSHPDLPGLLDERAWARAFLKPAVGSTSRETFRLRRDDLDGAVSHLERLLPDEDFLLQPYLERGETGGERALIFFEGELSHTIRKVPVAGDYRVQDDFGARDEPTEASPAEIALSRHALEAVGRQLLYARVDLLADAEGRPRLVELELVEPSLFFRHDPEAAERLAHRLIERIRQDRKSLHDVLERGHHGRSAPGG